MNANTSRAKTRIIGRRALAALTVPIMGIGTIALPAAVPGVSAVASAQTTDDGTAGDPPATTGPDCSLDGAQVGVIGETNFVEDVWPIPETAELVKTPIVDSDVNFIRQTGTNSFQMNALYRTVASPTIKGIDWFYLGFDEDLAPYIEQITIQSGGSLAIGYRRFMEEVKPDTLGNVNRLTAKTYGPADPYAGQPGVWRVLNDMNHIRLPSDNPNERTIAKGQWGVFNAVATQDQRQTAEINVVLNDTLENIKAATGKTEFSAVGRWQGQHGGGTVKEGTKEVVVGAADSAEAVRVGSAVPSGTLLDTLVDEEGNPYSSNNLRIDEGTLPPGTDVAFDDATGELTLVGEPTEAGTFNIKYAINNPGDITIDNGEPAMTIIDLGQDPTDIVNEQHLSGQTKTFLASDENVQPIMQDNRETAPAPAGVTNLRAVSAHANAIEYNLTTGKPYDVHLQIDPRLLDSLYQDPTDPLGEPYVVMWQKASHLAYKNSLPTPEANKQPLRIPRSAFDANGKVRVSERLEAQNEPNTVYIDDITRVINPGASGTLSLSAIRAVDIPLDNTKLDAELAKVPGTATFSYRTWMTKRDGLVDQEIKYSRSDAFYQFEQPCRYLGDINTVVKITSDHPSGEFKRGSGVTYEATSTVTGGDVKDAVVVIGQDPDAPFTEEAPVLKKAANGDTPAADLVEGTDYTAEKQADGSYKITFLKPLKDGDVVTTVIKGMIPAETPADGDGNIGGTTPDGDGEKPYDPGTSDPDGDGEKPAVDNTVDPDNKDPKPIAPEAVYDGNMTTVVKITSDDPSGEFRPGTGVTYEATSTVAGGDVKDAVVIINQDPDAPFTDAAPVLKKAANGTHPAADLVEGTDYTAEKQADGSYKITFIKPLLDGDVVTTTIKGLIPAETPTDGDGTIGGDGYKPGTTDPDGDGEKPAVDNTVETPDENAIYNGEMNTVVKITSDDPSGEFRPGVGVTYEATSTVTGGAVKGAVVIVNQDPDAPFTEDAPVLKKAANGTNPAADLVEGTDYTAEKQADGSYKITFIKPLLEGDVVTTTIKGMVPAETPTDGDGSIGGDGYKPGTTDPDGDGEKPAVDNTVENPDENVIYNGDVNTVVKITSDDPSGEFKAGVGVTYEATSTVTGGPVKGAVVIVNQDPDAPFTEDAPVLTKSAKGTEPAVDLVAGTDYTAEKQADGSYKITLINPLDEGDVVTTKIKGMIPAETPDGGDGNIGGTTPGGDGEKPYDPGTTDPDGDGKKPAVDNTVDPDNKDPKPIEGVYNGAVNTVVKITSDDPSGEFKAGVGVTYEATSTVTGGDVKGAVVIVNPDPDAPFTDAAPVISKVGSDGVATDLVEGTDYTAEKQADGSYKITFPGELKDGDVVTTVIKGMIPAETPDGGDGNIGGDGFKPGTTDPDGDGKKPAVDNTTDPENKDPKPITPPDAVYNGDVNTVVKITSDDPSGEFKAGVGVTYEATSTVTGGDVKDAVVIVNPDPDAPFTEDAPVLKKAANGDTPAADLVAGTDYTAEKQADGSYKITFIKPLKDGDVVTTVIKGMIPAETPDGGDGNIGGDGFKPGTTDPDGDGEKPAVDNTTDPENKDPKPITPAETTTPAPTETPVPTDPTTPAPTDTPAPTEPTTPAPTDTPAPTETTTPAPTETPAPSETTTPAPDGTGVNVTPGQSGPIEVNEEIPAGTTIGKITDGDGNPLPADSVVVDETTVPSGTTVTYNPATGELEITGIPDTVGDSTVTVTVTDPVTGETVTAEVPVSVTDTIAPTIDSSGLPTMVENEPLAPTVIATVTDNAGVPSDVTITGVPDGVTATYNPLTGEVTVDGTPTVPGDYTITIQATDPSGNTTSQDIKVTVHPADDAPIVDDADTTPPLIDGQRMPHLVEGEAAPDTVIATVTDDGVPLRDDQVTTSGLPAGLTATYDPATGEITVSGTPAAGTAGDHVLTITATDDAGNTTTQNINFKVYPADTGTTPVVPVPTETTTPAPTETTTPAPTETPAPDAGDSTVTPNENADLVVGKPADETIGTITHPDGTTHPAKDKVVIDDSDLTTANPGLTVDYDPETGDITVEGTPEKEGDFIVKVEVTNPDGTTTTVDVPVNIKPAADASTHEVVVSNISAGNADATTDSLVVAENNTARQQQNFLQGTAEPGATVTVYRGTGADREAIAKTTAGADGAWAAKICDPVAIAANSSDAGCSAIPFEMLWDDAGNAITAGQTVTVEAVLGANDPVSTEVTITSKQTTAPATIDEIPANTATLTEITGTLGAQHQNTTKTKVTAYLKRAGAAQTRAAGPGETELGSVIVQGDVNGGQAWTITLASPLALQAGDTIVARAQEANFPADFEAAVAAAKDDAYAESTSVTALASSTAGEGEDPADKPIFTPNEDLQDLVENKPIDPDKDNTIGNITNPDGTPVDPDNVKVDETTVPDGTTVTVDKDGNVVIDGTPTTPGDHTIVVEVTDPETGETSKVEIPVTIKPEDKKKDPAPGGSSGGILPIPIPIPLPGGSSGTLPGGSSGTTPGQNTGKAPTAQDPGQGHVNRGKGIDPSQQGKRHGRLAVTGADVIKTGVVATILAMMGAFLLAFSKRRRSAGEADES